MITAIGLALTLATQAQPLAVRGELEPLGRGLTGTVVGVALQIAPEDRERAGKRVRLDVSLVRGERVLDHATMVVDTAADGSLLVFREWPTGEGQARVIVESLDGQARGAWAGNLVVPAMEVPFEAPPGAAVDAVVLAPVAEGEGGGVRFLPPPRSGGIGALQLEVEVPARTGSVEFSQDDQPLVTRRKAPWTVSVSLGSVARRTVIRASAFAADGAFLGEDAIVLNGAADQLPVEILLGPAAPGSGERTVTVAVSAPAIEDVVLRADDRVVARWAECPCVARLAASDLGSARVLSAEARNRRGTRGEAVRILGESGFAAAIRVEQVELPVVVFDAAGRPVPDLDRAAFRVFEDGQEVTIDSFGTTADLPLSLGVVVDVSGSMEDSFTAVRQAVGGFLGSLIRQGDAMFLMTFAWDPKVVVPWTGEPRALVDALDRVNPEGGTSLHDAIVRSLEQFRGRKGRSAVVLLTDGDDTTSRTGWDVTLRYVKTSRTPLFPIGFRISKLDFFIRERLKDLAQATGGETFYASETAALSEVYRRISDQLRAQYLISYRSPSSKPAQEFRTVRVEVKGEGRLARTIAGYFPSQ